MLCVETAAICTVDTLAQFTDDILRDLNVAKDTVASFIDLRKAFDTVDHFILVDKMKYYGIKGRNILWVENYLTGRKQVVNANGKTSDELPVVCGVPQGSILGPLLFLIYVNDVIKCITKSNIRLYADDTVLYSATLDTKQAIAHLQLDLDNYQTWCIQNKLSINIAKTKIMVFSASKRHPNTTEVNIHLDSKLLQVVPSYKYLGVILDNYLAFDLHINSVHKMTSYKTYQLACLMKFINKRMALSIYSSTVLPYFDYADIIYMNANVTSLQRLQYDQNRALKIALNLPWLTNTDFVHAKAKLPKLDDRRNTHLENYMYTRAQSNVYLDKRSLPTRVYQGPVLKVLRANGAPYARSVEYHGAVSWNSLPPGRRNVESKQIFKKQSKINLKNLVPLVLV